MTDTKVRLADLTRRDLPEKLDYSGKPNRRLVTEWVVKTGEDKDGPNEVVVQVTTSHYRKALDSDFGWIIRSLGDGPFNIEKWSRENKSRRVSNVPIGRYSRKALIEAHAKAVALVVEVFEGSNLEQVVEQAVNTEGW
jgi:hypothetical protein